MHIDARITTPPATRAVRGYFIADVKSRNLRALEPENDRWLLEIRPTWIRKLMKALTLWQPWAWAIAHAGKRIENRTWEPPPNVVGQTIAIHAGKKLDGHGLDVLADVLAGTAVVVPDAKSLAHGAVVAVARVMGFVDRSTSRWFTGPIGWELADVEAVEPIPCRGAQGLWVLPVDVERQVSAALDRA